MRACVCVCVIRGGRGVVIVRVCCACVFRVRVCFIFRTFAFLHARAGSIARGCPLLCRCTILWRSFKMVSFTDRHDSTVPADPPPALVLVPAAGSAGSVFVHGRSSPQSVRVVLADVSSDRVPRPCFPSCERRPCRAFRVPYSALYY